MAERILNIPISVYTAELLISGNVKVRAHRLEDGSLFPRRISDILDQAGERMDRVGETEFIELANASIQDLSTREVLRTKVQRVVVNKRAVVLIVPLELEPEEEER
jgi:hypothetical protein